MASRKTHDISDSDESEVEVTRKIQHKSTTNRDSQTSKRKHERSPHACGHTRTPHPEPINEYKDDIRSPKQLKKSAVVGSNVGFFLTRVRGISNNYNHRSIAYDLKGILSDHDGELIQSVQVNYM